MQYMLLIHGDAERWAKVPEAQMAKLMSDYREFTEGIVKSGQFRTGAAPAGLERDDRAREGR
jgi:hypothetical protein